MLWLNNRLLAMLHQMAQKNRTEWLQNHFEETGEETVADVEQLEQQVIFEMTENGCCQQDKD